MKIAGFTVYDVKLPINGKPYSMSSGLLHDIDSVLLKITLENGIEGWGETAPLGTTYAPAHAKGALAALQDILPHLIGEQATPRSVHARMDAQLSGHLYAKAAVDIALHDALARHLDCPVSTLLGGVLRDKLPAYYAIGIETADETAAIGHKKLAEGFTRLQLKVGGRPVNEDIAAIHALWDVMKNSGAQLVVDANRGWTMRDAITISQACRDIPLIIEQPCDTLAENLSVRPKLCHPLYLDENIETLAIGLQVIEANAADGFGMKTTRIGGLAPSMAFRDACQAHNLPHTTDDNWGGDIIAAACLHFGATVRPDLLDGVWTAGSYIAKTQGYPNTITPKNGYFDLPEGPGLGVAPDESALGTPIGVYA